MFPLKGPENLTSLALKLYRGETQENKVRDVPQATWLVSRQAEFL